MQPKRNGRHIFIEQHEPTDASLQSRLLAQAGKACQRLDQATWKGDNHALLVFEGIDSSGERFVKVAHFMGKVVDPIGETFAKVFGKNCGARVGAAVGGIKKGTRLSLRKIGKIIIGEVNIHKFNINRYDKKTPTWILKAEKVETLIEKIDSEKGVRYPFHFAGKTSFLSKTAEAYDIYDRLLGKLTEENEDLFLKLYDSYCNEQKPTGMTKEAFDKVISKILDDLRTEDPKLFEDGVEYNYSYFMQLFEKEKIASKELEEHNCFTWAKHQLSYLGIELEESESFRRVAILASVTSLQVSHPIKADGEHLVIDMTKDDSPMASAASTPKPLSHRTITHKKDRDKRTEARKAYSRLDEKKLLKKAGFAAVTPLVISVTSFGGGVCWSLVAITAETVATVALGTAVGAAVATAGPVLAGVGLIAGAVAGAREFIPYAKKCKDEELSEIERDQESLKSNMSSKELKVLAEKSTTKDRREESTVSSMG